MGLVTPTPDREYCYFVISQSGLFQAAVVIGIYAILWYDERHCSEIQLYYVLNTNENFELLCFGDHGGDRFLIR